MKGNFYLTGMKVALISKDEGVNEALSQLNDRLVEGGAKTLLKTDLNDSGTDFVCGQRHQRSTYCQGGKRKRPEKARHQCLLSGSAVIPARTAHERRAAGKPGRVQAGLERRQVLGLVLAR